MFQLDERSQRTMYEQVMDNIKELIMTDVLKENDKLPSVRELSSQLTINPNTVQKAFKELEREGYIFTVSGKGTFVKAKDDVVKDPNKVNELLRQVGASLKGLLFLGYDEDEAVSLIHGAMQETLMSTKAAGETAASDIGKENHS